VDEKGCGPTGVSADWHLEEHLHMQRIAHIVLEKSLKMLEFSLVNSRLLAAHESR